MTDTTDAEDDPDGSSDVTDEQKKHTADLGYGSPTGDATQDPEQDSDTSSGGEPE